MLDFKPLGLSSYPLIKRFLDACPYRISAYSFAYKTMWKDYYHAEYAEARGCLIYKNTIFGRTVFNYPVPLGDEADEKGALREIEDYCVERYSLPTFIDVPQEKIKFLTDRYYFLNISEDRNYDEYMYSADDFRHFPGKKYAGQRNHLNKFTSLYPTAEFRPLTKKDKQLIKEFFNRYDEEGNSEGRKKESRYAKRLLLSLPLDDYLTGCYVIGGKIASLTFGTKMGDTLFIHIEKGLREYEGIYPATANAFAKANPDAGYVNREDDSGAKGLRISKTQYHPLAMVRKTRIEIKNEWEKVRAFPELKTERLTLTKMEKSDAVDYYDLCTDEARNKYWGYDYKNDLRGELYPEYFYDVQKHDLTKKVCFSFAVRLNGKMIGEGVLYRFTGAGQAEAGIRIAAPFAGHGYGKEAFYAMTDWAPYGLGLNKVVSKCYSENAASYKMLSSGMTQTGMDETFVYFERTV
ncbi:MAG: GNAT family N-acetyltransferase [Clostridia bacterium]|nr:GNAT family N-acetyltransferase [Clostridia bacterium]